MKLLVVLSALQTAAIVFLLLTAPSRLQDAVATPAAAPVELTGQEERFRRIVREELAARDAQMPRATGDARSDATAQTRTLDPIAAADQRAQLDLVTGQLEHYKRQGYMSPIEMQNYQADIARLDPASRKQMLSNLVRAMNAGEIRGEL